jgi:hypothetical protein
VRTVRNSNPFTAGRPKCLDARQRGRVLTDSLSCELGAVVDLSATGFRVKCRGRHKLEAGQAMTLTLRCPVLSVELPCTLRWIRKTGWFSSLAGFQFQPLTPAQNAGVRELARLTLDERTIAYDTGPQIDE